MKPIKYQFDYPNCPDCLGNGWVLSTGKICKRCEGTGVIHEYDAFGNLRVIPLCQECDAPLPPDTVGYCEECAKKRGSE